MKESKAEFQKALDCMLFEGVDSCWTELFLHQNGQSRCFAKENPQVSLNYIRFLSDRIQFLNRRIASFTAPNAEQTLLSFLRQQPQQRCEGVSMVKLSEVLNIGRTSLYRVVQQLEQNGVIKREGRVIQLMEEPDISREKRK